MPKSRLDLLLVSRGLVATRERARALILAGDVLVNGAPVTKAGTAVDNAATVQLRQPDHPWVGRGGLKLDHALTTFGLDVAGKAALDIGASTGGFTDVLLARGAAHVVALDVGEGQIDWRLRTDARVLVLERVNARYLTPAALPAEHRSFDVITIDVSFISLRHILPVIPPLLALDGRVMALVKPQFEAGRGEIESGGIVRDPDVHARVVEAVTAEAHRVGLVRLGLEPSPITGAEGNREFLMLLAHDA
ncbi:MAG TPA: TlyA family RNA methyltransferase [Vicinamibacterales bacterium]|jgi:23S rRNA (cytidine1920-2'-O)/16S rRNA (cytidine1409-2'-O)-methyltransferase|nr:TlyA family RNA methyltransferase [Vicinamibacterales bacterium]